MSVKKFNELAKTSGALYRLNRVLLVNLEILDNYLEDFRVKISLD